MRGIKINLIAPIGGLIAGLSAVGEKKPFSTPDGHNLQLETVLVQGQGLVSSIRLDLSTGDQIMSCLQSYEEGTPKWDLEDNVP
jgi:hypothetical protein